MTIEQYLSAKARVATLEDEIQDALFLLINLGRALNEHWRYSPIIARDGERIVSGNSESQAFKLADWPDVQSVATQIAEWHEADAEMRRLWDQLPASTRADIRNPDERAKRGRVKARSFIWSARPPA